MTIEADRTVLMGGLTDAVFSERGRKITAEVTRLRSLSVIGA